MSFGFGLGFPRSRPFAGGPSLNLQFAGSQTLDPRITFTRASTATYFDATGTLQTAGTNVARFDYNPSTLAAQGLLIEEQRTNSIRNNTMQGAVAGTPGTLPNNWVSSAAAGVSVNVIGTGTESGITYIDVQFVGTPLASGQALVAFDGLANMTATPAATYTGSLYIRRSAGSNTNVSSIINQIVTRDSGGVNIGNQAVDITSTVGATNIRTNRPTNTFTAPALTAFIQHDVRIGVTNGLAIDITLRIGLPQLELGAFATSVIPTTTTALTRSADVASVNTLSPWFNSTASTLYAEWTNLAAAMAPVFQTVVVIDDTSLNNIYRIFQVQAANTKASQNMISGGVSAGRIDAGGAYSNATVKAAAAFAALDRAIAVNGQSAVTSATGALPVSVTQMSLGNTSSTTTNFLNGYLRRITYYPRRLSNAELVSITS